MLKLADDYRRLALSQDILFGTQFAQLKAKSDAAISLIPLRELLGDIFPDKNKVITKAELEALSKDVKNIITPTDWADLKNLIESIDNTLLQQSLRSAQGTPIPGTPRAGGITPTQLMAALAASAGGASPPALPVRMSPTTVQAAFGTRLPSPQGPAFKPVPKSARPPTPPRLSGVNLWQSEFREMRQNYEAKFGEGGKPFGNKSTALLSEINDPKRNYTPEAKRAFFEFLNEKGGGSSGTTGPRSAVQKRSFIDERLAELAPQTSNWDDKTYVAIKS